MLWQPVADQASVLRACFTLIRETYITNTASLTWLRYLCRKFKRMVWDCSITDSYPDEVQYFAALDFAVPVDTVMMRTLPLNILSSWLVQTDSTFLVESVSTPKEVMESPAPPHIGLMVAMEERYLYGEGVSFVPTVGVGLVYKPPYVRAMSFSRANDILEYCIDPADEEYRITHPMVFFICVAPSSGVRPLMEPYPLWIDYSLQCHLECDSELWSTSCLRGFQLHQVVSVPLPSAGKKGLHLPPQRYRVCPHLFPGIK